jgi:hypothetical protein
VLNASKTVGDQIGSCVAGEQQQQDESEQFVQSQSICLAIMLGLTPVCLALILTGYVTGWRLMGRRGLWNVPIQQTESKTIQSIGRVGKIKLTNRTSVGPINVVFIANASRQIEGQRTFAHPIKLLLGRLGAEREAPLVTILRSQRQSIVVGTRTVWILAKRWHALQGQKWTKMSACVNGYVSSNPVTRILVRERYMPFAVYLAHCGDIDNYLRTFGCYQNVLLAASLLRQNDSENCNNYGGCCHYGIGVFDKCDYPLPSRKVLGALSCGVGAFFLVCGFGAMVEGECTLNPNIQIPLGLILVVLGAFLVYHGFILIGYQRWSFPTMPVIFFSSSIYGV